MRVADLVIAVKPLDAKLPVVAVAEAAVVV
jgi:hypothetical protein